VDSIYGRMINTLMNHQYTLPTICRKVSFLRLIITDIFILSEITCNSLLCLTRALSNSPCSLCHVHKLL